MRNIIETKMHLALSIYEYMTWIDPRLNYENNTEIPQELRDTRIDLSRDRLNLWLPNTAFTEENTARNVSEICYVYPNGTIIYYRYLELIITCQF